VKREDLIKSKTKTVGLRTWRKKRLGKTDVRPKSAVKIGKSWRKTVFTEAESSKQTTTQAARHQQNTSRYGKTKDERKKTREGDDEGLIAFVEVIQTVLVGGGIF